MGEISKKDIEKLNKMGKVKEGQKSFRKNTMENRSDEHNRQPSATTEELKKSAFVQNARKQFSSTLKASDVKKLNSRAPSATTQQLRKAAFVQNARKKFSPTPKLEEEEN